jgi:negative regulator of sigma E activity
VKTNRTKAASSTRSAATRRKPRRASKLAIFRVKVATVAVSMFAFAVSLVGVATYNPAVAQKPADLAPTPQINVVQLNGSKPRVVTPQPRVTLPNPFVRSRGS